MFDDIDFDKMAEREEVVNRYGSDEADLDKMRNSFIGKTVDKNAKAVSKIEESLNEVSDDKSIISDDINRLNAELEVSEEKPEVSINEELDIKDINEKPVVVDTATKNEVNNDLLKAQEEFNRQLKERDDLIYKMFAQVQAQQVQEVPKVEVQPEKEIEFDATSIRNKAKEVVSKIYSSNEEDASNLMAEMLLELAPKKQKAELDEVKLVQKVEELLAKRDAVIKQQKFDDARTKFLASEDGKKLQADEDLGDLFISKFNRLRDSGQYVNDEDLFTKAYDKTVGAFGTKNTQQAKPLTPKVNEVLLAQINESEQAKKQSVKPSTTSNTGKSVENKKFDTNGYYRELMKSMGQM